MSILSSLRGAVTGVLDTVTDVAKTAQEGIAMGTDYVHHRAIAFKETDREFVLVETSKTLADLKAELEADPNLAGIHDALSKKWGW